MEKAEVDILTEAKEKVKAQITLYRKDLKTKDLESRELKASLNSLMNRKV